MVQLIVRGVVDLTNNADLFTTVLDMINIMIHSTLITDRENGNSERNEENRKHYNYHALVKKLKKEVGDKASPSMKYLRQMLPLPKLMTEVIVTEPFGLETNEKGAKVKGFNCDKKNLECKCLRSRRSVLGTFLKVIRLLHLYLGPGLEL